MGCLFDVGYSVEPFRTLCEEYPDDTIYTPKHFRTEWGPIFHRGRLDSSARVLVIGQDPAENETIVRRILVGEAGRRTQGFLAKLGIDRSYVLINTFLYSIYATVESTHALDPAIAGYRNRWLDALAVNTNLEAVVALGILAEEAWKNWKSTPQGSSVNIPFTKIIHPTWPESSSNGNKQKRQQNKRKMLQDWNRALQLLKPAVAHPDVPGQLVLYGSDFSETERPPIPAFDLPAGIPVWMREEDNWASRVGKGEAKRANITITVPRGYRPK
jgi:uracil-DNA glycosylase